MIRALIYLTFELHQSVLSSRYRFSLFIIIYRRPFEKPNTLPTILTGEINVILKVF